MLVGVLELRDTPAPGSTGSGRLLDEVHSISSVSGGSFTALAYASVAGRVTAIEILLERKAKVDRQARDGATPLMLAAFNGHTEAAEVLIRAGLLLVWVLTGSLKWGVRGFGDRQ